MSNLNTERVLSVHHWNDSLFSFKTTRDPGLRFENGQFVMIGLEVEGRPLMRAYSIASPNYEDHLEFYSIKVPNGPLTSRLQHLQVGDSIRVSKKPTGTLLLDDLRPGKNLYLLATGTGLAPFLSLIQEPEAYERYEKIVLVHGCAVSELAYAEFITQSCQKRVFGELVRDKLIYYPTVTREPFRNQAYYRADAQASCLKISVCRSIRRMTVRCLRQSGDADDPSKCSATSSSWKFAASG